MKTTIMTAGKLILTAFIAFVVYGSFSDQTFLPPSFAVIWGVIAGVGVWSMESIWFLEKGKKRSKQRLPPHEQLILAILLIVAGVITTQRPLEYQNVIFQWGYVILTLSLFWEGLRLPFLVFKTKSSI